MEQNKAIGKEIVNENHKICLLQFNCARYSALGYSVFVIISSTRNSPEMSEEIFEMYRRILIYQKNNLKTFKALFTCITHHKFEIELCICNFILALKLSRSTEHKILCKIVKYLKMGTF